MEFDGDENGDEDCDDSTPHRWSWEIVLPWTRTEMITTSKHEI